MGLVREVAESATESLVKGGAKQADELAQAGAKTVRTLPEASGPAGAAGGVSKKLAPDSPSARAGGEAAGEGDEAVSVYHGSINHSTQIRANGFDPDRRPVFVTRDPDAATNAIGPNRYEVSMGDARDPGIIESRVPRGDFERVMAPAERRYTGFGGQGLDSSEIPLRSREAVDLFNRHIVRQGND